MARWICFDCWAPYFNISSLTPHSSDKMAPPCWRIVTTLCVSVLHTVVVLYNFLKPNIEWKRRWEKGSCIGVQFCMPLTSLPLREKRPELFAENKANRVCWVVTDAWSSQQGELGGEMLVVRQGGPPSALHGACFYQTQLCAAFVRSERWWVNYLKFHYSSVKKDTRTKKRHRSLGRSVACDDSPAQQKHQPLIPLSLLCCCSPLMKALTHF